ncbi:hypothetical protein [uncultured Treponema sp.]|uniref:hypothetical protein n=1 Tax=uncultured Treponema sp. TaxID=162155 RepID=UPI0025D4625E|nr:hypothetical protein [uncultured Treponema sp.]
MDFEINNFQILLTFLALLLVAVIVLICRTYNHKEQGGWIFTVTREGLNEQSEKIKSIFKEMRLTDKDMTLSLLILEEIVVRLHEHTDQVVTVKVRNFFGKVSLRLYSVGAKYNPFEVDKNKAEDSEDYLRDMIFKANSMRLSYRRVGKRNVVSIRARK